MVKRDLHTQAEMYVFCRWGERHSETQGSRFQSLLIQRRGAGRAIRVMNIDPALALIQMDLAFLVLGLH